MKLPFKLPKFGKKEFDDVDDIDTSSGNDPSELEDDLNNAPGETSVLLDEDSTASKAALDDLSKSANDEFPSKTLSEKTPSSEEDQIVPDVEDGNSESGTTAEEIEELNFSDDDNDLDFNEDENDEDDENRKSKKKLIFVGGGATSALILIGGIFWYLTPFSNEDKSSI